MRDFPIQTGLCIATLGALLAAMKYHPLDIKALSALPTTLAPATAVASPLAPLPVPLAGVRARAESPLLYDSAGVLDNFYESLRRTETRAAGGVTRIVHYGDSPTSGDLITADIRAMLQARYGDAGHGFILISKPWAWYQHVGVKLSAANWQMQPASRFETRDGLYGLGGVSMTGGTNASSRITYETAGYTRFEVWFLQQPHGGTLKLEADSAPLGTVDTAGDSPAPGFAAFEAARPASTIEIRVTQGRVRVFGLTADNAGPGVAYDTLGLNGASVEVMTRMFDQRHWAAELQHRDPALVIVNYGTNEADFPDYVEKHYERELREAVRRIRAALPKASILIMSPMDRGRRAGPDRIETMPTIPRIVAIQRRVAVDSGCGFFDTFQAMGGEGTMARWYTSTPRLVSADFIHPIPAGGKIVADAFVREILAGFSRFKLKRTVAVR